MEVNEPQENYITGYVKIYRSVMKKAWFPKGDFFKLWCYILMKATHKPYEYWFDGKTITLNAGQFVTGRKRIAEEIGTHESSVERMLTYFEKIEQQIEQQKSSTSRLISVRNWENYQNSEQQIEQPLNNERTTTEQPLNTKQEHKNIITKEIKEEEVVIPPKRDFIFFMKLWNDFARTKGLSVVARISDARVNHLSARMKEQTFEFEKILASASEQPFLFGENERKWKIDFDWLIGNDNNYIKVLERKYIKSDKNYKTSIPKEQNQW